MGKTKTAFLTGTEETEKKPSYDKAAKEAKRKARESSESGLAHDINSVSNGETPNPALDETVAQPAGKQVDVTKVRSKKYKEQQKKVDKNKLYSISEAILLVKDTTYTSFDSTLELNLIIKKEGFTTTVKLPHLFGKQKKVEVANDETIEKLKGGKIDFDVLLATADMMPKLVPFARLLGPKGMMPNPKNGTLIKTLKDADNFSTTAVTVKTEKKAPVIHVTVGKVSQTEDQISQNIDTILNAVNRRQVIKGYLKSTMSPSVKLAF